MLEPSPPNVIWRPAPPEPRKPSDCTLLPISSSTAESLEFQSAHGRCHHVASFAWVRFDCPLIEQRCLISRESNQPVTGLCILMVTNVDVAISEKRERSFTPVSSVFISFRAGVNKQNGLDGANPVDRGSSASCCFKPQSSAPAVRPQVPRYLRTTAVRPTARSRGYGYAVPTRLERTGSLTKRHDFCDGRSFRARICLCALRRLGC